MFKSVLVAAFFAVFSVISISALADNGESGHETVRVSMLNVANIADNSAVLLPVADKSRDNTENTTSQAQLHSADKKSESALSKEWLFAVALFWFVILSNRRGV